MGILRNGRSGVFVHGHVDLEDVLELDHAHILLQEWVATIVKE
jgi:hypothetical protein